jgi:predicted NUDIX family NTP pyrophosphohydrolase
MYRRGPDGVEVFLVHPGGPFFARKDEGAWTIPKGVFAPDEDPLAAALREFEEETGRRLDLCAGEGCRPVALGSVKQRGGKTVHAWGIEGDWPRDLPVRSNTVTLEWPPRSGRTIEIPEIDRGEFFPLEAARSKINPAQAVLIDRLLEQIGAAS